MFWDFSEPNGFPSCPRDDSNTSSRQANTIECWGGMKSDLNFNFGQGVIRFLRKSDEIESFLQCCAVLGMSWQFFRRKSRRVIIFSDSFQENWVLSWRKVMDLRILFNDSFLTQAFRVDSIGKLGEHPPDRMPGGLEREKYCVICWRSTCSIDWTCLEKVKNMANFSHSFASFVTLFWFLSGCVGLGQGVGGNLARPGSGGQWYVLLHGHVVARSCLVGAQTKDLKGMSQVGVLARNRHTAMLRWREGEQIKVDFTWNCQLGSIEFNWSCVWNFESLATLLLVVLTV